jgi:tRNA/tmRNA/rRNA uracil-C5-methylase (TrmA/RlmC/RlmD family)
MDKYLSTVIISIITGVFSIITLLIQKKQDNVINKIDEQTTFLERERDLKQKLADKEKERENIIYDMIILTLETNMTLLSNYEELSGTTLNQELYKKSKELKEKFDRINSEIANITREYEIVIEMSTHIHNGNNSNNGNTGNNNI